MPDSQINPPIPYKGEGIDGPAQFPATEEITESLSFKTVKDLEHERFEHGKVLDR
jgi:hypothetical protein